MFDSLGYIKELLTIRGVRASFIEYRTHEFEYDDYYLELNACNGIIFFIYPIPLPFDTKITGDNNCIVISSNSRTETLVDRIEEFTGQVIIELPARADHNTIFQYFYVNLA